MFVGERVGAVQLVCSAIRILFYNSLHEISLGPHFIWGIEMGDLPICLLSRGEKKIKFIEIQCILYQKKKRVCHDIFITCL